MHFYNACEYLKRMQIEVFWLFLKCLKKFWPNQSEIGAVLIYSAAAENKFYPAASGAAAAARKKGQRLAVTKMQRPADVARLENIFSLDNRLFGCLWSLNVKLVMRAGWHISSSICAVQSAGRWLMAHAGS